MTNRHRHRWTAVSRHQVSAGLLVYQRCACGQWRVTTTPPYPVAYPVIANMSCQNADSVDAADHR